MCSAFCQVWRFAQACCSIQQCLLHHHHLLDLGKWQEGHYTIEPADVRVLHETSTTNRPKPFNEFGCPLASVKVVLNQLAQ